MPHRAAPGGPGAGTGHGPAPAPAGAAREASGPPSPWGFFIPREKIGLPHPATLADAARAIHIENSPPRPRGAARPSIGPV